MGSLHHTGLSECPCILCSTAIWFSGGATPAADGRWVEEGKREGKSSTWFPAAVCHLQGRAWSPAARQCLSWRILYSLLFCVVVQPFRDRINTDSKRWSVRSYVGRWWLCWVGNEGFLIPRNSGMKISGNPGRLPNGSLEVNSLMVSSIWYSKGALVGGLWPHALMLSTPL